MSLFYRVVVIAVLLAVAGGAFAQPGEEQNIDPGSGDGSGGGCYVCRGMYYEDGTVVWSCASPDPGGSGTDRCSADCYDNTCYCQSYGNWCCVD